MLVQGHHTDHAVLSQANCENITNEDGAGATSMMCEVMSLMTSNNSHSAVIQQETLNEEARIMLDITMPLSSVQNDHSSPLKSSSTSELLSSHFQKDDEHDMFYDAVEPAEADAAKNLASFSSMMMSAISRHHSSGSEQQQQQQQQSWQQPHYQISHPYNLSDHMISFACQSSTLPSLSEACEAITKALSSLPQTSPSFGAVDSLHQASLSPPTTASNTPPLSSHILALNTMSQTTSPLGTSSTSTPDDLHNNNNRSYRHYSTTQWHHLEDLPIPSLSNGVYSHDLTSVSDFTPPSNFFPSPSASSSSTNTSPTNAIVHEQQQDTHHRKATTSPDGEDVIMFGSSTMMMTHDEANHDANYDNSSSPQQYSDSPTAAVAPAAESSSSFSSSTTTPAVQQATSSSSTRGEKRHKCNFRTTDLDLYIWHVSRLQVPDQRALAEIRANPEHPQERDEDGRPVYVCTAAFAVPNRLLRHQQTMSPSRRPPPAKKKKGSFAVAAAAAAAARRLFHRCTWPHCGAVFREESGLAAHLNEMHRVPQMSLSSHPSSFDSWSAFSSHNSSSHHHNSSAMNGSNDVLNLDSNISSFYGSFPMDVVGSPSHTIISSPDFSHHGFAHHASSTMTPWTTGGGSSISSSSSNELNGNGNMDGTGFSPYSNNHSTSLFTTSSTDGMMHHAHSIMPAADETISMCMTMTQDNAPTPPYSSSDDLLAVFRPHQRTRFPDSPFFSLEASSGDWIENSSNINRSSSPFAISSRSLSSIISSELNANV